MKKRMKSPNIKKSSRKHDMLLVKKGTILLSAIFSLPLRGGKIE
jgi:hypothetical protein